MKKLEQPKPKDNLESVLQCAEWIIRQLDNQEYHSLAQIFRHALSDAKAWVETMASNNNSAAENQNPLYAQEAELIRLVLMRYAAEKTVEGKQKILSKIGQSIAETYDE